MRPEPPGVLLVEDERLVLLVLERALAGKFRILDIVSTGEDAVERARGLLPDIVLLDFELAGAIDGLETARRILSTARPFIAFCSSHTERELGYPLESGLGDAVFEKPVNLMTLGEELGERYAAWRRARGGEAVFATCRADMDGRYFRS